MGRKRVSAESLTNKQKGILRLLPTVFLDRQVLIHFYWFFDVCLVLHLALSPAQLI